jgi:hypothetical protein
MVFEPVRHNRGKHDNSREQNENKTKVMPPVAENKTF